MTRYRIVELNDRSFALQSNVTIFGVSLFGWNLVCHPECPGVVLTYPTPEEAEKSIPRSLAVTRIVKTVEPFDRQ